MTQRSDSVHYNFQTPLGTDTKVEPEGSSWAFYAHGDGLQRESSTPLDPKELGHGRAAGHSRIWMFTGTGGRVSRLSAELFGLQESWVKLAPSDYLYSPWDGYGEYFVTEAYSSQSLRDPDIFYGGDPSWFFCEPTCRPVLQSDATEHMEFKRGQSVWWNLAQLMAMSLPVLQSLVNEIEPAILEDLENGPGMWGGESYFKMASPSALDFDTQDWLRVTLAERLSV